MWKKSAIGLASALALIAFALVVLVSRTSRSGTASGTGSCHVVSQANIAYETPVTCPAGEYLTGGGGSCYGFDGNWESWMVKSQASGNGWVVACQNVKTGGHQLASYTQAICCKP
jgi:hypothetical protein